jgi:hypothetical protein
MARGRKVNVSLAVVPAVVPGDRQAPPAEFDDTEAGVWWAIMGASDVARCGCTADLSPSSHARPRMI